MHLNKRIRKTSIIPKLFDLYNNRHKYKNKNETIYIGKQVKI